MLFKDYEMDKLKFHIKVIWVSVISRNILGFIGLFAYPFINKEKARKHRSFWWYMLNDDELERYDVDYDVKMVKRKGIPIWFASYWFNAIRNRAYNWLQSQYCPVLNVDKYRFKNEANLTETEKQNKRKAMDWQGGGAWFYPNEHTNILSYRYSKYFKFLGMRFQWQYGDFGDRYDMNLKKL